MANTGTAAYESGGNLDTLVSVLGAKGDASVTDPTLSGSGIALLKGLINANIDNYVLLASAAITTNGTSFTALNYRARGIKLFINTGAFGSGASAITVSIQGIDPVSGQVYTILTSPSLTASAFSVLTVYPGLTASANAVANDILPKSWRVSYQASNWGTGGSTLGIACAMII